MARHLRMTGEQTNLSRPPASLSARVIVREALKVSPHKGRARNRLFCFPFRLIFEKPEKGSRTPTSPVVRSASFSDAATRCLRSAPARRRSTRGSRQRDVGPKGSGPGQASWDVVSAGVTRGLLSQSSGSTPRTGRNAGEHDAQTRPRAECMAPRAGAAPAPPWLSTPRPKAPLSERDLASVTEMGT
jgi:hypothetical protein